jgi:hypothetical protein
MGQRPYSGVEKLESCINLCLAGFRRFPGLEDLYAVMNRSAPVQPFPSESSHGYPHHAGKYMLDRIYSVPPFGAY